MSRTFLSLFLVSCCGLGLGCSSGTGPVDPVLPVGLYQRVEAVAGGEMTRTIRLEVDSVQFADTLWTINGPNRTIDSTYLVAMEINPLADGYYRAAESHFANGALVDQRLSYRFFFRRGDSLYFYAGIRLRGDQVGIQGTWVTSTLDSAFNGYAYNATFTQDSLVVMKRAPDTPAEFRGGYRLGRDSIRYTGGPFPEEFGGRFEIIPGLALYLTTHDTDGYFRLGPVPVL